MRDKRIVMVVGTQSATCSFCGGMAGLGDSVHTIANPGYGTEDGCGKRFTHIALRAQAATPERVRQIITFFGNLRFVGIGEVVRDRDGFRFQLHRRPQDLFPQLGRRKLLRRKRTA